MRERPDISRSTDLLVTVLAHSIEASRFACRDLTDDEFFWEPVTPCWGVRRRGESTAPTQWGSGEWVVEMWGDDPPRVTTIGWRLVHLAVGDEVYVDHTFGDGTARFADVLVPGTAADAVARLERSQDSMLEACAAIAGDGLEEPTPTHWGERLPMWQVVWTSVVEHFHHAAEIGVLRDLRRGHASSDHWPELQHPDWWPV